jgi:hypothetical protein
MGSGYDGDKNKTQVEDESDALRTPFKTGRLGTSKKALHEKTTIVFYDTSAKHIKDKEIADGVLAKYSYPADKKLIDAFKDYANQVEAFANIRFFDINNLSTNDKKYLNEMGVKTPNNPDVVVRYGDRKKMHDNGIAGAGTYKKASTLIQFLTVANYQEVQKGYDKYMTVGHELGHVLGLKHPLDFFGFGIMSTKNNNLDNTIMTYNKIYKNDLVPDGKYQDTFGEYDVAAYQKMYGKSLKNIDYFKDIKWPRDAVYSKEVLKKEFEFSKKFASQILRILDKYKIETRDLVEAAEYFSPESNASIRQFEEIVAISKILKTNWQDVIYNKDYFTNSDIYLPGKAFGNNYNEWSKNLEKFELELEKRTGKKFDFESYKDGKNVGLIDIETQIIPYAKEFAEAYKAVMEKGK